MTASDPSAKSSVAVVTGGSRGMGFAAARRLGRRHTLLLADLDAAGLEKAAKTLRAEGHSVTTVAADISKAGDVARLAEATAALGSFAVLVHAAGLSPSMADPSRILTVNLGGTALVERAFLPLAGPGSCAVLIASTAGHMGSWPTRSDPELTQPLAGGALDRLVAQAATPEAAYSLSKRGVILYCETVAPEWGAKGARIVSISPGMIDTPMNALEFARQPLMKHMLDMTPIRRLGEADDIAAAVEFLTSDAAAFITGTDLRIDGGATPVFRHLAE